MQQSDIIAGKEYALREPPTPDTALQRVQILEKVRAGRWKAKWIDPNPGLIDYVKSKNLVCAWNDRKALLRDERHEVALQAVVDRTWPGEHVPTNWAVDLVLDSTGERECYLHKGVLTFELEAIDRICARAGVAIPDHPSGYRDRTGWHRFPYECGVQVAEAFAATEPRTVLTVVEAHERQLEADARQPGGSYLMPLLNNYRASWALIRQWAGHDAALAERDGRIKDLEELLVRTIWNLRQDGVDPKRVAARIDRAMHGR